MRRPARADAEAPSAPPVRVGELPCADPTVRVREIAEHLLRSMGIEGKVFCRDRRSDDVPHLFVEILSRESRLLIGDRGSTLWAFEHILRRCARVLTGDAVRIVADVNAYRVRRIALIRRMARDAAERARRTGRSVVLEPMRASDRRIVHLTLGAEEGVATESTGEDPTRRVIIRPKDPLV